MKSGYSSVVGHTDSSMQLSRAGTSMLVLSMTTAQAAAAARRVSQEEPIDAYDRSVLSALEEQLRTASLAIKSPTVSLPSEDVYALLDVALNALSNPRRGEVSPADAGRILEEWADDLHAVGDEQREKALEVCIKLSALQNAVNSSLGSSGETPAIA